ncbi:MAG: electron transport complex subunit RsxC [Clostridia bacterium]|nr:electron transport complex subunit RsxC [Clostridia bacterium]
MAFFKLGKTHVPHRKNTAKMPAERIGKIPETVLLPMSQHIGAPSAPIVKPGERVFVGTLIAEAGGFVGAPIHSSVSGTVKKIESYLSSQGKVCSAIRIESDGLMEPDPNLCPPEIVDFASLFAAVRASGLVGLGGAGFPTSVKLSPQNVDALDTLVINGAECEPYITSDTRTMLDEAHFVKEGIELIVKHSKIKSVVIGIEKNKKACIKNLAAQFANNSTVKVHVMPDTYPQGAEKILIYNTTGRVVPEGKLPADVGVLVMNVTSVAFLAKYAKTGMPLVEKCVTVDGSAVKSPRNVIAPIGTAIADILSEADVNYDNLGKVLYGGPMMGVSVYSVDDPILKNTNAITALNIKDSKPKEQHACVHCGRCVAACPMGLMPTVFSKTMNVDAREERAERLTAAKVNLCIECGCCSFVCPSARPLVENNRLAKADLREYLADKKSKEDAKK